MQSVEEYEEFEDRVNPIKWSNLMINSECNTCNRFGYYDCGMNQCYKKLRCKECQYFQYGEEEVDGELYEVEFCKLHEEPVDRNDNACEEILEV